jgi:hypothetical protein
MKTNPTTYLPVVLKLLALLPIPALAVPDESGQVLLSVLVELITRFATLSDKVEFITIFFADCKLMIDGTSSLCARLAHIARGCAI